MAVIDGNEFDQWEITAAHLTYNIGSFNQHSDS